jgi:activator of HSP90 ATPase
MLVARRENVMAYDFEVSDVLPATPAEIYDAWMTSDGHSAMTGAEARVDARAGGLFEAWDGYITGRTLALEPGRRIVQSWRTTEFASADADSQIEVLLEPEAEETRITLRHTNVPDGRRGYEQGGWQQNYFDPMREYFRRR